MKVNFVIRKGKKRGDGQVPIEMTICVKGKRRYVSTGLDMIAKGLKLPMEYFLESVVENNRKPKARGKNHLMSEILKSIKNVLLYAEKQNVDGLREFFDNEPTRPLIATGHGGKYSQAVYAALLYSTNKGLGRALNCMDGSCFYCNLLHRL